MNFNDFFLKVKAQGVEIQFDNHQGAPPPKLSNEAMFHLPLIAITILVLARGHAKPTVHEIGQLVGDCYELTFPGFRGSAQNLGWSAALRVRTVQALAFLEQANLVDVGTQDRRIATTQMGRAIVEKAISTGGDLASNLAVVERSYRNIRIEKQLRLTPA